MTLDEAIKHCKDVARDNRAKAEEEWRAFSIYPFGNVEESATFVDRCDECAEQHEQLAQWLEELKEYEELEEQGLLLKLPCKVGDTVWEVQKIRERIQQYEIISVNQGRMGYLYFNWELKDGYGYYGNLKGFGTSDIGKTVFLTKEEAEQELKRLECAENE
jgi:hypothetical protein